MLFVCRWECWRHTGAIQRHKFVAEWREKKKKKRKRKAKVTVTQSSVFVDSAIFSRQWEEGNLLFGKKYPGPKCPPAGTCNPRIRNPANPPTNLLPKSSPNYSYGKLITSRVKSFSTFISFSSIVRDEIYAYVNFVCILWGRFYFVF